MCFSSVVCYLATFALDELGLQVFRTIVKALDSKMMQKVRHSNQKMA